MIKNLIIRSSSSILLNGELKSNFGDLVRSTILLNCINGNYLWLTDSRSVNLLKWFVPIEKIITEKNNLADYDFSPDLNIYNVDNYIFDKKVTELNGKWHGFVYEAKEKRISKNEIIALTEPYKNIDHKFSSISWQQALVEGMGFFWKEQDYAMPLIEDSILKNNQFDVGLNWHVHPAWKSKHWPLKNWEEVENILKNKSVVSWQQGLNDFDEYIKWLSSCKVIVTCDTLGLHLASALRKKVIAITGPTENGEFPYQRLTNIKPSYFFSCLPCNSSLCNYKEHCLETIKPLTVVKVIEQSSF